MAVSTNGQKTRLRSSQGLSISGLAWWLLCQAEMELNRRIYPAYRNRVVPGISIKHWLRSDDSNGSLNSKDLKTEAYKAAASLREPKVTYAAV